MSKRQKIHSSFLDIDKQSYYWNLVLILNCQESPANLRRLVLNLRGKMSPEFVNPVQRCSYGSAQRISTWSSSACASMLHKWIQDTRLHAPVDCFDQMHLEDLNPIFNHHKLQMPWIQPAQNVQRFAGELHEYEIIHVSLEEGTGRVCSCNLSCFMGVNDDEQQQWLCPLPPLAKLLPICHRVSAARSRRWPCVPWAVRHASLCWGWWLWARPFVAQLLVVLSSRLCTRSASQTGQTLASGLPRPPFRASWCPLLLSFGSW